MSTKKFNELIAARRTLNRVSGIEVPNGASISALHIGADNQEALVVETPGALTAGQLRKVHKDRQDGSNVSLAVAELSPSGVRLLGPDSDANPSGVLTGEHAARILTAVLDEPTSAGARVRLAEQISAIDRSNDLPGVKSEGLFATHYLKEGVRRELEWDAAVEAATPILPERGGDLIGALGFSTQTIGDGAHLLATADEVPRAVAVLIGKEQGFETSSTRLGSSPVQYGLAQATKQLVPWLVVLRGSQLRLYPVRPDVGVGRRSQAETYFELDLAVVDERTAGFLELVFSSAALAEGGTVDAILEGSNRYATSLGERLRDRVYEHVVPELAVAVAAELERIDPDKTLDDAYRITLKILFRLLFQAYAEDQGLLPYNVNDRFTRNSLTTQAHDLLEEPDRAFSDESHSIWDDLQQVWAVIDTGNEAWGVPAYNGGLFGSTSDHHPDGHLIAQMKLADKSVGSALHHLLLDITPDGGFGLVDFRSLSVREFGTIYEGLLESSLSKADTNLTVDKKGTYLPAKDGDAVDVKKGGVYHHNASGERKSTGSYFTPSFAVEHLLDRALDPTLDEHLERVASLLNEGKTAEAAEQFFDFRVADLAMGSGHFLVAAIDHIEVKMNAFLVDHPIPRIEDELNRLEKAARDALGEAGKSLTIERQTLLRRQIARRCIYGLDVNEIAVELARVAIWIHTFVPGLPMSTLDHNLVCGNSLTGIGTMGEALDALEPDRKPGQPSLFSGELETVLEGARSLLVDAANSLEATKAEVEQAAEKHAEALALAADASRLMDAAMAIRLGVLSPSYSVTELLEKAGDPLVSDSLEPLSAAHLPFLFPEVMERPRGGFDVLIGNPPWDQLVVDELDWWAARFPDLRTVPAPSRPMRIEELARTYRTVANELKGAVREVEGARAAVLSGPYPGIGAAHVDLFAAFAWRNWQLLRPQGRIGLVLPRSALSGSSLSEWRVALGAAGALQSVSFLVNTGRWLFDMEPRYTVALTVIGTRGDSSDFLLEGPFHSLSEWREASGSFHSNQQAYLDWSEKAAIPLLPSSQSASVFDRMAQSPRLFEDGTGHPFVPSRGDIGTTAGRPYWTEEGDLPVYAGSTFRHWDPDAGSLYARADSATLIPQLLEKAQRSARRRGSAYAGVKVESTADLFCARPRISIRWISRANDSRTAIPCLIPPGIAVDSASVLNPLPAASERHEAFLLGILSSVPFDWVSRRWVEMNLTFEVLRSLPAPGPDLFHPLSKRVIDVAAKLAAVDDRFEDWAEAVGVKTGQLKDPKKRADAIAEIDALTALLYELEWDDVEHIFETFHRGWDYTARVALVRKHYLDWEKKA